MSKKAEKLLPVNSESQIAGTATAENYQWIAEAAYFKALARGFTPILDQDDWFEAKKEYEALLLKQLKSGLVSLR